MKCFITLQNALLHPLKRKDPRFRIADQAGDGMKFHVITSGNVTAPRGFKASGMRAGIKKSFRKSDVSLICSETRATAAGAFTTNQVKAWPLDHDLKVIR